MTQTWHADDETLRSWATGSAAPLLAASVEAHLLHCADCRRRTSGLSVRATPEDAVRRWDALADRIDRPRTSSLLRLGLATPGLRTAWLASLLLLLALPVVVTMVGIRLPLFMALAPVAPLAAVAIAYGRDAEPAGELALATVRGTHESTPIECEPTSGTQLATRRVGARQSMDGANREGR